MNLLIPLLLSLLNVASALKCVCTPSCDAAQSLFDEHIKKHMDDPASSSLCVENQCSVSSASLAPDWQPVCVTTRLYKKKVACAGEDLFRYCAIQHKKTHEITGQHMGKWMRCDRNSCNTPGTKNGWGGALSDRLTESDDTIQTAGGDQTETDGGVVLSGSGTNNEEETENTGTTEASEDSGEEGGTTEAEDSGEANATTIMANNTNTTAAPSSAHGVYGRGFAGLVTILIGLF